MLWCSNVVRYLLNVSSYCSFRVEVEHLDPLDVLLFLLALKMNMGIVEILSISIKSAHVASTWLKRKVAKLPSPGQRHHGFIRKSASIYLDCTSQQQEQKLLHFFQTLFCWE